MNQENTTTIQTTDAITVGEALQKTSFPALEVSSAHSPWEGLELTSEEVERALDTARMLKYEANKKKIQEERRREIRELYSRPWTTNELYSWLMDCRAARIGFRNGKQFGIDQHNHDFFKALCYYFSCNQAFEKMNAAWSIRKGLLVCGGVGTGKTTIMRLFSRNTRQCYDVLNAAELARLFAKDGDEAVEKFGTIHHYEPDNPDWFYQREIGICFDDLGTEDEKVHYGNKSNVMADIILQRYAAGLDFDKTHITTNLSADGIKNFYGPRVFSRMMEMMNVIDLTGPDRRLL